MKSFKTYLSEIYRITPKRRAILDRLDQDAIEDLRIMTQQQDKKLKDHYTGNENTSEQDPNNLHDILFNNSTTLNALSKLARMRRIDAIRQQGIHPDKRKSGFLFFGKDGPEATKEKPTDKFLKKVSKNERGREKEFKRMGTPPVFGELENG